MRGYAVFEGIQQETETFLGIFLCEAQQFEHFLLNISAVDSDGAAAQFVTVQYDVVCFRTNCTGICIQQFQVFVHRCCKRMVYCHISVFFFVPFQHREFCNPQETEVVGSGQFQHLGQFQTQGTQRVEYNFVLICTNQNQVAGFTFHFVHDFLKFFRCEEFCNLGFQAAIFVDNDPSQTFCTICFHKFNQRVDFLSGERTAAFCVDSTYAAASFQCGFKYHKVCAGYHIGNVYQFHAETYVGLIGTEAFHSFFISHALQGQLHVYIHDVFEYFLHQSFVDVHDIVYINEGQFHVHLCKFRLSVCTQVFVTEAFCNLVITVHTGNHQQLFVQLRGLRQTVEVTGMHTAGNQIVSGTFRCGFAQNRCFDFQETFVVQEGTESLYHLMTQNNVLQLARSSQIQVSVFQTQIVFDCDVVFNLERCCFRFRQDTQFRSNDFDFPCFHVRVDIAFCSSGYNTAYSQCVLTANGFSFFKNFFGCGIAVDGNLYQTCSVTQSDEDQLTQVTATLYPPHNGHFLTNHGFIDMATHVASFQAGN